jgi:hypothetical protein
MVFMAIHRLTNMRFATVGAFALGMNLSYAALTYHALADVCLTAAMAWLVQWLSRNAARLRTMRAFYLMLLYASACSALKPVFGPLVLLLLLVVLPACYWREFLRDPHKARLLGALVPVILQAGLVGYRHHTLGLSDKSLVAVRDYWLAQGFAAVNAVDVRKARTHLQQLGPTELARFAFEHKGLLAINAFHNMARNLAERPMFLAYPPGFTPRLWYSLMSVANRALFAMHVLLLLPSIALVIWLFRSAGALSGVAFVLLVLFLYLVGASGLVFWEGDRYAVSLQPLWIALYSILIHQICAARVDPRS